jgi:hypothetical protein
VSCSHSKTHCVYAWQFLFKSVHTHTLYHQLCQVYLPIRFICELEHKCTNPNSSLSFAPPHTPFMSNTHSLITQLISYGLLIDAVFSFYKRQKVVSQKMFHTNWSSILLILSTMFKVCLKFYRMCNKDVALSVQSFHKLWIQTVAVVLATRKSLQAEADQWKSHRCHNLYLKRDTPTFP